MKTYTVNNIKVVESNKSLSGYYGATVSPAWTLDYQKPFIARMSEINPFDHDELRKLVPNKDPSSYHLGYYQDSREAAYVAAMYRDDPLTVLKARFGNSRVEAVFPKELYDLPVYYTLKQAQEDIDCHKNKITTKTPKSMKLPDALKIARDTIGKRKPKNIPAIRQYIENNIKTFKNEKDVIDSIKNIIEY